MDRSRARLAIVSAAAGAVAVATVAFLRRRRRLAATTTALTPAVQRAPEWLRAFVSARFNPVVMRLGLVGGRRSPWALLEHTGRRSGTAYRTPVLPMVVGSHAFVPLPYGEEVNWVRNVRAAGHCRLQQHGAVLELDEPAIVTAGDHPGLPAWSRGSLERSGRRYLRLHVLAAQPGALEPAGDPGVPASA
jgi:deazaflavin-dependent oxidoreductase (nitroreductase family)